MGTIAADSHPSHQQEGNNFVKVVFKLGRHPWHGHRTESMWAEPLARDEYAIRNVPFFAYGVSYGDLVRVRERDGLLVVCKITGRSGHSTYRLFVKGESAFTRAWTALQDIGCTYERATEHLYGVDVPETSNIDIVYAILEGAKRREMWDFEEGHCGHPNLMC